MAENVKDISGTQKAAILLVSLGPEMSARVMQKLNDAQIEKIGIEIATLEKVSDDVKQNVLGEAMRNISSSEQVVHGGMQVAQDIIAKSLGAEKAAKLIGNLDSLRTPAPFGFVKKIDPTQLLNFIRSEHPQTIALVLSHLDPDQAAVVLSSFPAATQADVVRRIATMDKTTPEIIKDVESVLKNKLSSVSHEGLTVTGGIQTVAEVLNRADRKTEKEIMSILEKDNLDLFNEIRKLMFVFEDIILIDDRGIQQVLKSVDNKELAVALKTASEEVKDKILRNMSKRAAQAIKEDMEFMGPVKLRQVEEAQQKIVAVVRKNEESGDIVIQGRGSKEDELVG
ncbi:MAG: flagellar motor switch protein FliG [Candidatus Omnitrophota bacterium]|nr:MAG: flagellar motor switch protein FliG [Candidatus Omnitrophota bacterium]